eukprot:Ihof_evm2s379 gene=Ihof_evmTU2s379
MFAALSQGMLRRVFVRRFSTQTIVKPFYNCSILPTGNKFLQPFKSLRPTHILIAKAGIMTGTEAIVRPTWEKRPHVNIYHGEESHDDYHWIRNKTEQATIDHLTRENEYAKAMMTPTQKVQDALFSEFIARLKEDDDTAPFKRDNYTYYSRTEKGKEYSIYCRKDDQGAEQTLLDVNQLAVGHPYCNIATFRVSPNHKMLAFNVDFNGDEKHITMFKDLETGVVLEHQIKDVYYSLEWAGNNTVFYDKLNDAHRASKIMRHVLGTSAEEDVCVYEETDDLYDLFISQSTSEEYVFIKSESKHTSETRYVDASNPLAVPVVIQSKIPGMEYQVEHIGDRFYIRTNRDDRINFSLFSTRIATPGIENWVEVVPYNKNVNVYEIGAFANFLVLYERANCLQRIHIIPVKEGEVALKDEYFIDFKEPVYAIRELHEQDFNADRLRFVYCSPTTPDETYSYDLPTQQRTLDKKREVQGGYNRDEYECERIAAIAEDGVEIPVSMFYKKTLIKKDGSNPCLLIGYGSYGICYDYAFQTTHVSLADRGMVVCIAHIRGGGDNGRQWYYDGKLFSKKNTFTDFISCAQRLIDDKITSSDRLCITGASAGGLLIGATLNLRPDLFKAAVANVPFVDVINTMMDATIPLTVQEYEEWGNPNEKESFDYMRSYSPYDNLKPGQKMPNMLVLAGLHDPRVQYWEPAKYMAKLREYESHTSGPDDTNPSVILLETKMAGHFGASGRYAYYR